MDPTDRKTFISCSLHSKFVPDSVGLPSLINPRGLVDEKSHNHQQRTSWTSPPSLIALRWEALFRSSMRGRGEGGTVSSVDWKQIWVSPQGEQCRVLWFPMSTPRTTSRASMEKKRVRGDGLCGCCRNALYLSRRPSPRLQDRVGNGYDIPIVR